MDELLAEFAVEVFAMKPKNYRELAGVGQHLMGYFRETELAVTDSLAQQLRSGIDRQSTGVGTLVDKLDRFRFFRNISEVVCVGTKAAVLDNFNPEAVFDTPMRTAIAVQAIMPAGGLINDFIWASRALTRAEFTPNASLREHAPKLIQLATKRISRSCPDAFKAMRSLESRGVFIPSTDAVVQVVTAQNGVLSAPVREAIAQVMQGKIPDHVCLRTVRPN